MVSDSHIHDSLDQSQYRGMQRSEAGRQVRAAAVDCESVLDEVIGPDAEERDIIYERVDRQRCGRRLHHHTERKLVTVFDSACIQLGGGFVQKVSRLSDLVERDDQREHDANIAVHCRSQQCPKLSLEQLRLIEAHPDGTPAEERIRIRRIPADGQLVSSNIESPDYDGPSSECFDHVTIGPELLLLIRHRGPAYDEKFGPHQTHALRTAMSRELGL